LTVTVSVVVLEPSAVTDVGLAANVEVLLLGEPTTNVTFAVLLTEPMVAVTVFDCTTVDVMVAVNTPDAFVLPDDGENAFPEPVLLRLTACPEIRLPCASFTARVNVVVVTPSAGNDAGLALRLDVAALGPPATNVTEALAEAEPKVAVIVSACAKVEDTVEVNTPDALVVPEAGVKVLPVPVLVSVTA
jgi:hypothetical protein